MNVTYVKYSVDRDESLAHEAAKLAPRRARRPPARGPTCQRPCACADEPNNICDGVHVTVTVSGQQHS